MTLENWAEIGRLIKLTPSRDEVLAIFGVVKRDFHDASLNGLSSDQKYILSYQAALEAAMALLHCHGYKPIKTGHHYITWQCLREMLPEGHRPAIALFQDASKKLKQAQL